MDSDVNPADWSLMDPAKILSRTLKAESLSGGSIIDLHEGYDTEDNGAPGPSAAYDSALPRILDELKAHGHGLVGFEEVELVEPTPWYLGFQKSSV